MRFGCCGSLVASAPDRTGVEIVERLAEYGYDYIELPLAEMMDLDGGAFGALRARVEASSLRCETCNNFFPARVRLTGPEADLDAARDYCVRALDRAAELGAAVVVFGSAGAKRVPGGFSMVMRPQSGASPSPLSRCATRTATSSTPSPRACPWPGRPALTA